MTSSSAVPAIAVRGLRKAYGAQTVLAGVDLDVAAGTVFSLLGPNCAGKTTMVRILSTLIRADAGEVRILGHDLVRQTGAVRAQIGVTGQFSAVDNLLTGAENLRLMADLLHLGKAAARRRVAELLSRFELADAADKPLSTYSGGMRRRLDLAMTLVGQPRLIFLDEPTTGLDPTSRRTMWQIIRELVADGVTIFLTTQYLSEADELADRVALLDHGAIVAEGTPAELKSRIGAEHFTMSFADSAALHSAAQLWSEGTVDSGSLTLRLPVTGTVPELRRLLDRLDDARIPVVRVGLHRPDLDDVFFALTGHPTDSREKDVVPV